MQRKLNFKIATMLFGLVFNIALCSHATLPPQIAKELNARYVVDQILIRLKAKEILLNYREGQAKSLTTSAAMNAVQLLLKRMNIHFIKIKGIDAGFSIYAIQISESSKLQFYINQLNLQKEVEFAEPNFVLNLFDTETSLQIPNDPEFSKNWNYFNAGQVNNSGKAGTPGADINILPLWNSAQSGSHDVVVAILDTGIDWNHEDLKNNLFTNWGESGVLSANGIDDDQNGYIDDVHGWNFVNNNNQSQDDHRHGTHCAGIIGAKGNNQLGGTGIFWNAKLLPIKFIDRDGAGTVSDVIEGMHYATKMGARIFNNSWGNHEYSKALRQAIEQADNAGVLFIAAAGNSKTNNDLSPSYPSSYVLPNIISVAANDNTDQMAYFTNYGPSAVDVFAPGLDIFSTLPNNKYGYMSGTSMASPHIAGIAAWIASLHPELNHLQIKERILTSVDSKYGLKGFVSARGRVNAFNAVNQITPIHNDPDWDSWQDFAITLSSDHPYPRMANQVFTIKIPDAKKIRLHFNKIEFESLNDSLRIKDENDLVIQILSGGKANFISEYINGNTLKLQLLSNDKIQQFGFEILKAQYVTE